MIFYAKCQWIILLTTESYKVVMYLVGEEICTFVTNSHAI